MSGIKWLKTSKAGKVTAAILMNVFVGMGAAQASDLNADAVMNKMNSDQRVSYVAGVIEGLAYARFRKDTLAAGKNDETGMKCIYDWYYRDNANKWKDTLFPVFKRYKDKQVAVILYVLTKKKCGA